MGSDGARVTLPVEKGKRGARTICRSELARDLLILESRSQPSCLGSDYRMWRGRKKLCVVYDCFAAGRSLAVLVNCYGGRARRSFGRSCRRLRSFLQAKKKTLIIKVFLKMVPRGRLELPLLAKTDFESAASTNSAIRAQWRRSIEMTFRSVNNLLVYFY